MTKQQQKTFQLIWGVLLLLAGIGVFFRIPQVMPKIEQMESFSTSVIFIRFCFYLIGCLLIGGGVKKIINNYRSITDGNARPPKSDV